MKKHFPVFYALLAAALYALNSPVSKLLLDDVAPAMMAALLYLGAGAGMFLLGLIRKASGAKTNEARLSKKDVPYAAAMIVLDVLAPIFLMLGLMRTTAENASLINNFEIVATSLVALVIFREKISPKLWLAIGLITLSSIILSVEDASGLRFSIGSAFVLAACVSWGFENNMTRKLSMSDPMEIVVIKGLGSGTGAMITAAARLGLLAAGVTEESATHAVCAYARHIGLAFQIIDDLLDVIGDEKELGKPIGSDAEEGKTTFLNFFTPDEAKAYAERLTESAKAAIAPYENSEVLAELADYLLARKK